MLTFIIICVVIWVLAKSNQANKRRQQAEALYQLERAIRNLPYHYQQNTTEFERYDDKRKVVNYTAYLFGVMLSGYREISYDALKDVIPNAASSALGGFNLSSYNDNYYVYTMFELGKGGNTDNLKAVFDHLNWMQIVKVCDPGKIVIAMSIALGTTLGITKSNTAQLELALKFLAIVCIKLGCRYNVALDIVREAALRAGMSFNFQAIQENQIQEACRNLGVARSISREEFRRVKRNKLAQWHPDKAPAGQEQYYTSKYQEINGWCELIESQWK